MHAQPASRPPDGQGVEVGRTSDRWRNPENAPEAWQAAGLARLEQRLAAGEDPLYLARRMVRFASEDVGLADPQALTTALNGMEAFRFLGARLPRFGPLAMIVSLSPGLTGVVDLRR